MSLSTLRTMAVVCPVVSAMEWSLFGKKQANTKPKKVAKAGKASKTKAAEAAKTEEDGLNLVPTDKFTEKANTPTNSNSKASQEHVKQLEQEIQNLKNEVAQTLDETGVVSKNQMIKMISKESENFDQLESPAKDDAEVAPKAAATKSGKSFGGKSKSNQWTEDSSLYIQNEFGAASTGEWQYWVADQRFAAPSVNGKLSSTTTAMPMSMGNIEGASLIEFEKPKKKAKKEEATPVPKAEPKPTEPAPSSEKFQKPLTPTKVEFEDQDFKQEFKADQQVYEEAKPKSGGAVQWTENSEELVQGGGSAVWKLKAIQYQTQVNQAKATNSAAAINGDPNNQVLKNAGKK